MNVGLNFKELLLQLRLGFLILQVSNQERAGCNRCLDLMNPKSIVVQQIIVFFLLNQELILLLVLQLFHSFLQKLF